MKCTDCNREIEPVVAIDMDGTMADYHQHFYDYSCRFLGIPTRPNLRCDYEGDIPFKTWWMAEFMQSSDTWHDVKLAYRQGAMKRSQPPIEPTYDLAAWTRAITGLGVELWITTTRPYLSLDRVDRDTRFWLDHRGIIYDGLLYDDDKYAVLADRVGAERVIAVLDDLPEMYDAAQIWFGDRAPILRRNSYNTKVTRPNVTSRLSEAYAMIRERVGLWRTQNG